MKNKYIIFDLDDTLVYEMDYLESAYLDIAKTMDAMNYKLLHRDMLSWYHNKFNVFNLLIEKYPLKNDVNLLEMYRNHLPDDVHLNEGAIEILDYFKNKGYKLGLVTDGRTITQRNKIKALGIENKFNKIIISEEFGSSKPDLRNFHNFTEHGISEYYYIADNPTKDFISPNVLGWTTICLLNNGKNIHPQNFDLDYSYLPKFKINKLIELINLIS
ncbi:HAD family hydrolase [Chryseobacterium aquaticum]|uniref:HAD family hydrolase n=1 Tax=Chryseobacterium aquaticum TaxID=452084 RepID=A0A848NE29_9FLAO|nr:MULTISPECIES: HAD family hydrolase [Chryseobacterium]NMR35773.1 HAD family hydrolase [Chryseobacterium aquaticum]NRQ47780.1 HAD family hydrolase [Chryseobacterium sp. C-204]